MGGVEWDPSFMDAAHNTGGPEKAVEAEQYRARCGKSLATSLLATSLI